MTKVLKYLSFILTALCISQCKPELAKEADGWMKTIGSEFFDECYDIAVDDDGNVYFAGVFSGETSNKMFKSKGALDIMIGKFDANGALIWAESLGGKDDDEAYGIAVGGDQVYVCGYFSTEMTFAGKQYVSKGEGDAFVLNYSSDGKQKSAYIIGSAGNDEATAIQMTSLGDAMITGFFEGSLDQFPQVEPQGASDIFVATINARTQALTLKAYGSAGNDGAFCACLHDDEFIIGGSWFADSSQKEDNLVMTLNSDMELQSMFTFGSKAFDKINSIGCNKNKIFVSGEYRNGQWNYRDSSFTLPYQAESDAFIACFNTSEDMKWIHTISSKKHEWAKGMVVSEGNLYVSSEFNDTATVSFENNKQVVSKGLYDVYLAEMDESGKAMKHLLIQGAGEEGINKVIVKNNYLYACGWVYGEVNFGKHYASSSGEGDVYVWKTSLKDIFIEK